MHNKILKKFYFINKFNQSHIDKQDKETAIIYRNYDQKIDEKLIIKIKNYCKKRGNKFLLSNNIRLSIKLDLDGVYIPSFNKDKKHLSYSFKKKFIILGSSHNVYEIRTKELQNVVLYTLFRLCLYWCNSKKKKRVYFQSFLLCYLVFFTSPCNDQDDTEY